MTDGYQAALGHMLTAFGETSSHLIDVRFPDVPTIMISRGKPQKGFPWGNAATEATWLDGYRQLIGYLSKKQQWVAEDSAHAVVLDQPEIVVSAIAAVTAMADAR